MRDQDRRPVRQAKLVPGTVNRDDEHIELKYGDANTLDSKEFVSVALVARGPSEDFTVQYTLTASRVCLCPLYHLPKLSPGSR